MVENLHLHRKKRRTVLVIIPGLCGTAGGVSKICQYAAKRGFHPVVFNRRGLGNSFLTTPKLQSYGDPSDLRQVVKYLNGKYPKALITCVSYGTTPLSFNWRYSRLNSTIQFGIKNGRNV
jgi:abhydrolase domain-containing protein 15